MTSISIEIGSSIIISYYLRHEDIENTWLDARKCIKTDNYYRDANLDWEKTKTEILMAKEKAH